MANLFSLEYGKVSALNAVLAEQGLTAEHGEAVLKNHSLAHIMVVALVAALGKADEALVAFVNYLVQPTINELRKAFDWVNDAYTKAKFEPIEICRGIDQTNREVAFRYFKISRRMTTKQILAAMDKDGLRPAMYEELLAFASKYPDEHWCIIISDKANLLATKVSGGRVSRRTTDQNDAAIRRPSARHRRAKLKILGV